MAAEDLEVIQSTKIQSDNVMDPALPARYDFLNILKGAGCQPLS